MNNEKKSDAYKQAGVDVALGDLCSKILYEASKKTWENRAGKIGDVAVSEDAFGGLRYADFSNLPEAIVQMNFDGIGTKVEVAERMGRHDTMAFDLLAMVCDDAAIRGTEPILAGSILDVRKISLEVVMQLAEGLVEAAKAAGVSIMNGELAELGDRVGGFGPYAYNWGATVLSVAKKDRLFSTLKIKPGHHLVALRENGFRSNGLSLVRRIAISYFGARWHEQPWEGKTVGDWVLTPSIIYSAALVDMFGGYDREPRANVIAAAHITGGGVPGKLGRCLRSSGYGASLDDLFDPPRIMIDLQRVGNVVDRDAYKAWNMGQGMIVVTDTPEAVISVASERGIEAKVVGEVVSEPGIAIRNKGCFHDEEEVLVFPRED